MKKKRPDDFLRSVKWKKIILAMKLTCLLTLWITFSVTASVYSQTDRVTLEVNESTLSSLLIQIKDQTGIRMLYNENRLQGVTCHNLNLTDVTVEDALKAVLHNTNLWYSWVEGVVVIMERSESQQQSGYTIGGKVVDEVGGPLPGVTVLLKGSTIGTMTDSKGEFTIRLPEGSHMLMFSFVGYQTQEKNVNREETLQITLKESQEEMEEVVVTGYQTVSRERSAGSFSTILGEEIASRASLSGSILESLEGLASGFAMNLGDEDHKFTIRGISSLRSNTSPLFVVDNVPISAENLESMLNPNDIKNVTVLKDATAASIWGSQAANGVIVITTKTGRNTENKLKISYDGSFNYTGYPDRSYLDYMSSSTFIKNVQEIFDPVLYPWSVVTSQYSGTSNIYPVVYPHELPMYRALNGDITDAVRDEQLAALAQQNNSSQIKKHLMSPKLFTKHALSFTGGSDDYNYYGSVVYDYIQGTQRDNINRYALNFRQDIRFKPWISLDFIANIVFDNTDNSIQLSNTSLYSSLPYMMLRDEKGKNLSHADLLFYNERRDLYEEQSQVSLEYIPLDEIRRGYDKSNSLNLRLNAGLEVKLWEGLIYNGRFSYQRNNTKSKRYNPQESYITRLELAMFTTANTTGGAPTHYLPSSGGQYREGHNYEKNWTIRNQFNFDRQFGSSYITALAGMEIQANRHNSSLSNLRGYDDQTMTYIQYDEKTIAIGIKGIVPQTSLSATRGNMFAERGHTFSERETRYVSFYGNAAYTYLSKYSLNGSIRMDQSNLFGSDPSVQYKPVWSVGANWNMRNENFMESADFINRLNIRLSYGLGGNSPSPDVGGSYDVLQANSTTTYNELGYILQYPANNKIRWERTRTWNLGIDFSMFNSILSGNIDIYNKYTTDLLTLAPMNPAGGWVTALANFGEMSNRGFELSLSGRIISNDKFGWNTSLLLSYNKNKVQKLYMLNPLTPTNYVNQTYVEGFAASSLFAYKWAGLDSEYGDPQVYNSDGTPVKLLQDLTDTKVIKYMGTSQPPFFGSFTNNFRFNDFKFSFMLVYNFGHKMRNDLNTFWGGRATANLHKDFDKRWRASGDEKSTDIPSYVSNSSTSHSRRSMELYTYADINVLSASYLKMRDVTLSYSLPRNICDKISAESASVRIQASNLFYIAANKEHIDPEAISYLRGIRSLRNAPSWSISLSLNFK